MPGGRSEEAEADGRWRRGRGRGAVIEVYTEWSGNCTSVLPTLQKLRAEMEDDESMQFLSVSPRLAGWLVPSSRRGWSLPLATPAAAMAQGLVAASGG